MKILASVGAAILLAACAAKSSDEDQVRELIDGVEAAAEARDTSDVLEFVADDYADSSGSDKGQLRNFLRGYFLAHPKVELLVSIQSLEFPVDGLAQAVVTVRAIDFGGAEAQRLKVEFRRAGGGWRVTRADRLAQ